MEITGAYYEAGGLFFDGVDDFAEYVGAQVTAAPLTLCAWIKQASLQTIKHVLTLGDSALSVNVFTLRVNAGNAEARARVSIGASTASASGLIANQWQHIAAVFVSATERYAVLNGTFGAVNTTSRSPASINRTAMAYGYGDTAGQFGGLVADARVYNRALTQSELSILALRPGIAYEMRTERYTGESIAAFNRRRRLLTGVA